MTGAAGLSGVVGAIRFLLALAVRTDRGRLLKAAALLLVGYLATPFIGVGLKAFTDAAVAGLLSTATALAGAVALLLVFELMMSHFAHLYYFELGELMAAAIDADLLDISNGTPGLEHFDAPQFADTLTLVRQDVAQTRPALEGVLNLAGLILRAVVTTVILATVNPWLALLPVAAVPPVLIARTAQHLINRAKEATAERTRLTSHLVELATSANAVQEVRLFGADSYLLHRQAESWAQTTGVLWRALWQGAALRACGQLLFAFAYGAAILLVLAQALEGSASLGDVVLVITLAVQVSMQVAGALGLLATLQAAGRTIERLALLRAQAVAAGPPAPNPAPVPARLVTGIRLDRVSFAYPGRDTPILREVSLHVPSGSTVALVGENGAGKSTLVKLLCGLYQPTAGTITVDGVDLARFAPEHWRGGIAMLFQDFARLQLLLRENVGVGDLPRADDDAALSTALAQARAETIVAAVPGGLDGLLGHGYGDGVELSGGQWQTLGLARSLMRPQPLLLALDEPAAALDAQAEHALFERFAASGRDAGRASGAITLFVSHRFSTVRMADLIVVLDGGRIVEQGSHAELVARGGHYAELFALQARVYR